MFLNIYKLKPHKIFDFGTDERTGFIPLHILEAGKFNEDIIKMEIASASNNEIAELFRVVAHQTTILDAIRTAFGTREFVFGNKQHAATLTFDRLQTLLSDAGVSPRVSRIIAMIYTKIFLATNVMTFDGSILNYADSALREVGVTNIFTQGLLCFQLDQLVIDTSITESLISDRIKGNRVPLVFATQVTNTYIRELFLEYSSILNENNDIRLGMHVVSNAITNAVTIKEVLDDNLYKSLKFNQTFIVDFVNSHKFRTVNTDYLSALECKLYLAKASAFLSKYFSPIPFADAVKHLNVTAVYAVDDPDVVVAIALIKESNLTNTAQVFRSVNTDTMAWLSATNWKPSYNNIGCWDFAQSMCNALGNFSVAQFETLRTKIRDTDSTSEILIENIFPRFTPGTIAAPLIITNCNASEIYNYATSLCNGGAFIDTTNRVRYQVLAKDGESINYRSRQIFVDGNKTLKADSLQTNDPLDALFANRLFLKPASQKVKITTPYPELSANGNAAYINFNSYMSTASLPNVGSYQLSTADFATQFNDWGVTFNIGGVSKYEMISIGQEALGGLPGMWPTPIEVGRITEIIPIYNLIRGALPMDATVTVRDADHEYNSFFRHIELKLLTDLIGSVPENARLNLMRLGTVLDPREYLRAEVIIAIKHATLKGELFCGYTTDVRTLLFNILEGLTASELQQIGGKLIS